MKSTLSFTFIFFLFVQSTFSQFNPIEIIDKLAGTLLPEVVNGVKSIKESNKKSEKNAAADKLQEDFVKEKNEAINEAKKLLIREIGTDIEYLEAIGIVQNHIARMSNDVGRLSIFKDERFVETLLNRQAVVVKNGVVRNFQNALEQVNNNMSDLRAIRNKIDTSNIPADARASVYLSAIISKLEEINSIYNDCSKLNALNSDEKKVNECLRTIRSVSNDIARLENLVEDLNTETSAMLMSFMKRYKGIRTKMIEQAK